MSGYMVAIGHNNSAGLALLDPQPARLVPLAYAEIIYGGEGYSSPEGYLQTVLTWSALQRRSATTYDMYGTILSAHGLSLTVTSADCTVYIPLDMNASTWVYANVIAQYEQRARRNPNYWNGLEITYSQIETFTP